MRVLPKADVVAPCDTGLDSSTINWPSIGRIRAESSRSNGLIRTFTVRFIKCDTK